MWGPQLNLKTCIWITHCFNKSQQSITVQGKIMESVCNTIRTSTYSNMYGAAGRPPISHTTMRYTSTKHGFENLQCITSQQQHQNHSPSYAYLTISMNAPTCTTIWKSIMQQYNKPAMEHITIQTDQQIKQCQGALKPSMKLTKLESFTAKYPS